MPHSRQLFAVIALSIVTACSNAVDLSDPNVIAQALRGTWSRDFGTAGSSTVFSLTVSGSTISGTGTFADEAGPSGSLTVTGQITPMQSGDPEVDIVFAQNDGWTGHFSGTLSGVSELSGIVWYSSVQHLSADPVTAEFRRTSR